MEAEDEAITDKMLALDGATEGLAVVLCVYGKRCVTGEYGDDGRRGDEARGVAGGRGGDVGGRGGADGREGRVTGGGTATTKGATMDYVMLPEHAAAARGELAARGGDRGGNDVAWWHGQALRRRRWQTRQRGWAWRRGNCVAE